MKILTVVGARPQFIKSAMVSRVFKERGGLTEFLVHTGQHFDENMSEIFFEQMGMAKPDANLGISGGSHAEMTSGMLVRLERLIIQVKPQAVLVYGDTNSTLAGALASAKLQCPVAHVEAGLRSYNRKMPEEINRIITDHLSDLLFAPTEDSVGSLLREGIPRSKIVRTGDVMLDASLNFGKISEKSSKILQNLGLEEKGYALCTFHRAENVDHRDNLEWLIDGLNQVSEDMTVVLPMHPRTQQRIDSFSLMQKLSKKVKVCSPLGYLDILQLQKHSSMILTDSGGMQKEAFFHQVPCVTLRTETEWKELLTEGHNRLAVPMKDSISEKVSQVRESILDWSFDFYGDGNSARTIVDALFEKYNN